MAGIVHSWLAPRIDFTRLVLPNRLEAPSLESSEPQTETHQKDHAAKTHTFSPFREARGPPAGYGAPDRVKKSRLL
jgi:hypothetical protein